MLSQASKKYNEFSVCREIRVRASAGQERLNDRCELVSGAVLQRDADLNGSTLNGFEPRACHLACDEMVFALVHNPPYATSFFFFSSLFWGGAQDIGENRRWKRSERENVHHRV